MDEEDYYKLERDQLVMTNKDIVQRRLSFYGRLADEITREIIPPSMLEVSMPGIEASPFYKPGGYFAFSKIPPSLQPYSFNLRAASYMSRTVEKTLPPDDAASIEFEGEDELYLTILDVQNGEQKKVSFATIPYLKPISTGAQVFGENAFSTTLAQGLEGEDVQFAMLQDVTGLSPGQILRVKRSPNLIMRPGPYYPFPKGTTLALITVVDAASPLLMPLTGAVCQITQVNEIPVSQIDVNGVDIYTVTIGQDKLILGPAATITARTDSRGNCIFYYPQSAPVTKLKISVTAQAFDSKDLIINLNPGERTVQLVQLDKS